MKVPHHLTAYAYHSNRLSFGVPLEDVFPEGEIHPGLTNFLGASYRSVTKNDYRVQEVLSSLQGSLKERLKLKQRLVFSKEFDKLDISPGASLWVLRHFFGLLPIPLFCEYSNSQKYTWKSLSEKCKLSLVNYATRGRNNQKLVKKLANELLRLPQCNFLLAATLLDFLRMLAVLPAGEPKINKSAVFALVKYFSPSLFLRPFRPGWETKTDRVYYPLLLYLILKWPEIHRICKEVRRHTFSLPRDKTHHYDNVPSLEHLLYFQKQSKDNTTQTPALLDTKLKQRETLLRIVPRSYNDFSFLRDAACQTETVENILNDESQKFPAREAPNLKCQNDEKSNDLKARVIFIRKDCCCTYSTNYETNSKPGENQSKPVASENNNDFQCESTFRSNFKINRSKPYGWNFSELLDEKSASKSGETSTALLSPLSEFADNASYSYDNYSTFNLICDNENSRSLYETVKTFDPIEKDEKHLHNKDLKEKISKIGWTYTSPNETIPTSTDTVIRISSVAQQDSCEFYEDIRKSLNEELKNKLNKLKLKEKYEEEIHTSYENDSNSTDSAGSHSKLNISSKLSESKKSLISLSKMKSKLEFLRIFSSKKNKAKKSFSFEQVGSRVKYEKMGSVSSIL